MEYAEAAGERNTPHRLRLPAQPGAVMVPPMFRTDAALGVGVVSLLLAACGGQARSQAAEDAARLLAAAQAGDQIGFEARIARPSLRDDLRRQLAEVARTQGLEVEGGPSDAALDRMIAPEAFRLVDARTGQSLSGAPTPDQVRPLLQPVQGGRMCLGEVRTDCRLTFERTPEGRWVLVGMQAQDLQIPLAPPRS